MLKSLEIHNYKNLDTLIIPSLSRINLITAPNNAGKTTLLEAITLLATKGNAKMIDSILNARGSSDVDYASLFHYGTTDAIYIGTASDEQQQTFVRIKLENYQLEVETSDFQPINLHYTSSNIGDISVDEQRLWDNIALTNKKYDVIAALKILEPRIEDIHFGANCSVIVRLSGVEAPVSLRSMGGGINHILSIALNLVCSDNGIVLIDEIENGLHFREIEKLWQFIFTLAEKLDTQVFITTHSADIILSFTKILNEQPNSAIGQVLRIDRKKEKIKAVMMDADALADFYELKLEAR
ncbi:MAG: AAA family ATPase [Ignavibacteria bacterium]|jgi:predicted ATPase|nr:AAA family ATPase [Ignavibacteria bacterium]